MQNRRSLLQGHSPHSNNCVSVEDPYSHRKNRKIIMTSASMLNEGSDVPLGAACYSDATFCVPAEICGASRT
jgi:hypothetical protein